MAARRLSKWTVEAILLSDDLAKLIAANGADDPEQVAKEKEMATIIEPSKGTAPQIDDGLYAVTCRGIKSVTVDNDQFGNFEKIELSLEIEGETDEHGDPLYLDPRCNRKWGEKATLFQWAQAFGVVASTNEPFDAEDLIGKRAQALIETPEDGGWPRVTKMTALKTNNKRNLSAELRGEAPSSDPRVGTGEAHSLFWARTRKAGLSREEVNDASLGAFDKLPADMDAGELLNLAAALKV